VNHIGGRISPRTTLTREGLEEDFRTTFQRVKHLALKTHQKDQLIFTYLIPHFLCTLVLTNVPATMIQGLDQELHRKYLSSPALYIQWAVVWQEDGQGSRDPKTGNYHY
jgi:hypothetical protein